MSKHPERYDSDRRKVYRLAVREPRIISDSNEGTAEALKRPTVLAMAAEGATNMQSVVEIECRRNRFRESS
jgi:hypothetical protein